MGTSWHQDNAYFKISNPMRGTAMWIAIHEANLENGCLHIIPGSHRQACEHYRDKPSNHHIRCNPQEECATPIELASGDVAFFCYGVALHFLHSDYGGFECWEKSKMTCPMLCGPWTTGATVEFGQKFPGRWDELTEQSLFSENKYFDKNAQDQK